MAHLKIYRSRQALLINYPAVPKPPETDNLKVSLKAKTKDKPVQPSKAQREITPPQTKKTAKASETKTTKNSAPSVGRNKKA